MLNVGLALWESPLQSSDGNLFFLTQVALDHSSAALHGWCLLEGVACQLHVVRLDWPRLARHRVLCTGDLQVVRKEQAIVRLVVARVSSEVVFFLIMRRFIKRDRLMLLFGFHRWRVPRCLLLLLLRIQAAKLRVQEALRGGSVG